MPAGAEVGADDESEEDSDWVLLLVGLKGVGELLLPVPSGVGVTMTVFLVTMVVTLPWIEEEVSEELLSEELLELDDTLLDELLVEETSLEELLVEETSLEELPVEVTSVEELVMEVVVVVR